MDHVTDHGVRAERADDAHPAACQLLDDLGKRRVVEAEPAELAGHVAAEQAEPFESLDDLRRVLVGVLEPRGDRQDFVLDELTDAIDE